MLGKLGAALALVLALGPLIVLHELGHYLVARLFNVKVARFSIGFGRIVWSRRFGRDQTEWALSMLPFGGYVKWCDSADPDQPPMAAADLPRQFTRQDVWRRIAITAAGPLANFLIAIALFGAVGMLGETDLASRVRAAEAGTPAFEAGLRGGETITAVNGKAVTGWTELRWEIMQAALDKRAAELAVDGPGGPRAATLPAAALGALDLEGDFFGALGLGIWTPPPRVLEVKPGGAAARGGLLPGDLIVSIDGRPVADSSAATKLVRAGAGRPLAVGVLRAGRGVALSLTPAAIDGGKAGTFGRIDADLGRPQFVTLRVGLGAAVKRGAEKTWAAGTMTLQMIGRIITGEASYKNISGLVTMADYAGQSASLGLSVFLGYIAFISVSLGVMNLLPIPVLDGGFLLYYSVEVLTGRPLPERALEFFQRAGFVLLLMLMALALFNDAVRYL
ncbi:RIP metalloprotease RseP [Massilia glaciei]|uniref:Zinc metalloprotease n=1 Tax=Massilia glaciei TaxID=1524097 RepID=A0A2U2HHZ6_9BURK|nr:RIP metalloprotease RseP [Massilia glaciei]PWF45970.1 RIP metalloprotease RseP [Massilia glaciei]